VVGNGNGMEAEAATFAYTAGFEGVITVQRATVTP
jgi:hypothetical protein